METLCVVQDQNVVELHEVLSSQLLSAAQAALSVFQDLRCQALVKSAEEQVLSHSNNAEARDTAAADQVHNEISDLVCNPTHTLCTLALDLTLGRSGFQADIDRSCSGGVQQRVVSEQDAALMQGVQGVEQELQSIKHEMSATLQA